MTSGADVLIVIPCLNEEKMLPGLLAWLQREHADALVVVADGGSCDSSRFIVETAMLAWPSLRLLENPQHFQSAGVNLAARVFGEGRKWLVRIDAHAEYPDDYVRQLIAAALQHGVESVVVPMVTTGSGCFQVAAAAGQNSVLGTGGSPHRHVVKGCFVDHGHHALMRLDSFLAVDGYDPTFSHNEDAELDFRLQANGCRIWLEPGAALRYHPRASAKALWNQYFKFGKGRARTVQKHRLRLKVRQVLPLVILPAVISGLIALPFSLYWPLATLFAVPVEGQSTGAVRRHLPLRFVALA